MKEQFLYFLQDIRRMLGKRKSRILYIWLSRAFVGVLLYRAERSMLLTFGKSYQYLRILFLPLINLLQAYSNIDIHYQAAIKGGLSILHPSMGIVISGKSIIGANLTLVGGNVIGISKPCNVGDFIIGDNCSLGANAVVLGPLKLGATIKVGAMACVVKDCLTSNVVLTGIPAQIQ